MPVKKLKVKNARKSTVKKSSVSKPKMVRASRLAANVYNMQGKVVSKVNLPKEVFGAKVNDSLIAQTVRVYLANQRMGTASTKNRGEITGSTKKIWRQKGTGRARHGSRKAPIFVGGGVAFGPRTRDYSLKIPKKMKKAALFSALSQKQNNGEIKVVTGLEKIQSKTKFMAGVLKNLKIESKKRKILLVTPDRQKNGLENVYRAARNIEGVRIQNVKTLNTYEILDNNGIIFMKAAIEKFEEHFLGGKD